MMKSAILCSLLLAIALVGSSRAESCRNIEHSGNCGTYSETGQLQCEGWDGEVIYVCTTHPVSIVYPASINDCVPNADVGKTGSDSSGEEVTAVKKTYKCDGCTVVEVGEEVIQRCNSATLVGETCTR